VGAGAAAEAADGDGGDGYNEAAFQSLAASGGGGIAAAP
jgi:hypothetical protein